MTEQVTQEGNAPVMGSATGRPEAATHVASMAATHASAVDHLSLAVRCRAIAAFYARSDDRRLQGLAALWAQRASHAEQVAQNRASLTARHAAAAAASATASQ